MASLCDGHSCSITCSNFPACMPLPLLPPSHPFHPDDDYANSNNPNSEIFITVSIIAFFAVVSLILACLHNSGSDENEARPPPPTPAPVATIIQTTNPNGIHFDSNRGDDHDVTHHVWLIKTVGLDEEIIKSIPASVYNESSTGSTEYCSVCLGEFSNGEEIKLLQKCYHVFHAHCIDTWLKSHVTCPLCREPVTDGSDCLKGARISNSEPNQEECFIRIESEVGSSSRSMEKEDVAKSISRSCSLDSFFSFELSDAGMIPVGGKLIEDEKHTDFNGL